MNGMMESIKTFEGKKLPIRHIPGPEGVRGRNSDNDLILEKLGWEPTITLKDGLKVTYFWIKSQLDEVRQQLISSPAAVHAATCDASSSRTVRREQECRPTPPCQTSPACLCKRGSA